MPGLRPGGGWLGVSLLVFLTIAGAMPCHRYERAEAGIGVGMRREKSGTRTCIQRIARVAALVPSASLSRTRLSKQAYIHSPNSLHVLRVDITAKRQPSGFGAHQLILLLRHDGRMGVVAGSRRHLAANRASAGSRSTKTVRTWGTGSSATRVQGWHY